MRKVGSFVIMFTVRVIVIHCQKWLISFLLLLLLSLFASFRQDLQFNKKMLILICILLFSADDSRTDQVTNQVLQTTNVNVIYDEMLIQIFIIM